MLTCFLPFAPGFCLNRWFEPGVVSKSGHKRRGQASHFKDCCLPLSARLSRLPTLASLRGSGGWATDFRQHWHMPMRREREGTSRTITWDWISAHLFSPSRSRVMSKSLVRTRRDNKIGAQATGASFALFDLLNQLLAPLHQAVPLTTVSPTGYLPHPLLSKTPRQRTTLRSLRRTIEAL